MFQIIPPPPPDTPYFQQRTQLDGTDYLLVFRYNFRTEMWFLTVSTLTGEPIVQQAIVVGFDLFRRSNSALRPAGQLFALPSDNTQDRPKLNDLGVRVDLTYEVAE